MNGSTNMVKIEKKLMVKPSLPMDVLKGWVRINKDVRTNNIERNAICSIKVKDNNKKIFREIRGIDNKDEIIKMDLESRLNLDVKENKEYTFEIKKLKWWCDLSYYRFYLGHPERGIKLSMTLGIISLVLGIVSVRQDIYSLLLALYHLVKNVLLFILR